MGAKYDTTGALLYLTTGVPARVGRTVLSWVRVDTDNDVLSNILMRYADAPGSVRQGIELDTSSTNLKLSVVGQGSGGSADLLNPLTVGTWMMLATVTRQGSGVLITDGYYGATASAITLVNSVTSVDTADTSASFVIGGSGADNSGISAAFTRAWDAELTLTEIKAEFASPTAVRTSNIHSEYRFESGALTVDSSGNGHTLQVNGTPVFTADPAFLAPTINVQPVVRYAHLGEVAIFSVSATTSGGSLTYQWQDNSSGTFTNISGATASTYSTVYAAPTMNARKYRCVVSDDNGSATSNTTYLWVVAHQAIPAHLLRALNNPTPDPRAQLNLDYWTQVQIGKWFADELGTLAGGTAVKVWNGSAWVVKPVKYWNGSAWVVGALKRWSGSAWV